ncbi:hypothetical protein KAS41_01030 [Candidatus Parcubacteria bacterium]|nr:hypothetical protein [Candidatus Parcubacteria bacterium]
MPLEQLIKKTNFNHSVKNKTEFQLFDIEKKIQGIILGLFGSIIASFSIALGVSVLTSNYWTILSSGLIVGVASSFANSFGPLVAKSKSQSYSKEDILESTGSFIFTFIIIALPLISYLLMGDLNIARIISLMTGIVLLFIFGVHRAQLENRKSPLAYAFTVASVGGIVAAACYFVALNFIK